jgi:DNA invertase Pin-like site-specific DNA recombinase
MPKAKQIPVVVYSAKSTEDKHGSIPTQIEDCEGMAEREGWRVIGDPAKLADAGFSAYTGNRGDGLERAKQLAADAAAEFGEAILLTQHSDRLARGAGDKPGAADSLVEIWHAMKRQNVTLRSVQNDPMLSDPLLVAAASKLAYEESKRKSAAVKSGMKRRREAGKHHGGPRSYGYGYKRDQQGEVVKGSTWQIVKAEAVIVDRIFSEYAAGAGQRQITRDLIRDKVPTRKGGRWAQGTVSAMLRNVAYIGKIEHDGELFDAEHEAIVSDDLWQKVADRRERHTRTKSKGTGRPPRENFLFLKGTLTCTCGSAMVPRSGGNRKAGDYAAYYCLAKKENPAACDQPNIPRTVIDGAVFDYFTKVGLDVEQTRAEVEAAQTSKAAEIRSYVEVAERDRDKAQERLDRVRGHFQDGKLDPDDWAEQRDELTAALDAATAKAQQMGDRLAEVEEGADLCDVEGDTLRALAEIRSSIAGAVTKSTDIAGAREAIMRLFSGFRLRPSTSYLRMEADANEVYDLPVNDHLLIEPIIRPQAISSEGEDGHYVLPLTLNKTSLPMRAINDSAPLTR